MKLLTQELRSRLPKLYSQEAESDPIVYAKFFLPGTGWTWYVTEGEPEGDDFRFFGFVVGLDSEFGYFQLSELESVRSPLTLAVERDLTFTEGPAHPCRTRARFMTAQTEETKSSCLVSFLVASEGATR